MKPTHGGLRSKQPEAGDKHVGSRMNAAGERLHEDAVPAAGTQVHNDARILPVDVVVKRVVRAHNLAVLCVVAHRNERAAAVLGAAAF